MEIALLLLVGVRLGQEGIMRKTIALGVAVALAGIGALAATTNAGSFGAFQSQLTGAESVPGPVDTAAVGNAVVTVTPNGVRYTLVVNNAVAVVAAHIHCAPVGAAGPVGVTLFAGAPVTMNGILAQGPIVGPDGPPNGCDWETLDDVIAAMESGDTYVNVHTLANLAGEIRGQLQ
jgi:hypothetical protein